MSDKTELDKAAIKTAQIGKEQQELMHSRLISSQFGNMVTIMMQSPHHKNVRLSELPDRLVPPLTKNQFRLAEARKQGHGSTIPVGMIIWARVSDDVHNRMMQQLDSPFELKLEEWQSGDNYWIIDAVGPERFLAPLLSDLRSKDFKDKTVYFRSKSPQGPVARTLDDLAKSASQQAAAETDQASDSIVTAEKAAPPAEKLNGQHAQTS